MITSSWKYRYFSYFFGKDPKAPDFHWNHRISKTHCEHCASENILSLEDAYHDELRKENFPENLVPIKRFKQFFFPKTLLDRLSPPLKISYSVVIGLWSFFMILLIGILRNQLYYHSLFDLYLLEMLCLLVLFFFLLFTTDKFYAIFYKKWRSRYYCEKCGFVGNN